MDDAKRIDLLIDRTEALIADVGALNATVAKLAAWTLSTKDAASMLEWLPIAAAVIDARSRLLDARKTLTEEAFQRLRGWLAEELPAAQSNPPPAPP